MPRDIRSYFISPNTSKKEPSSSVPKRKNRPVISSDEEEEKIHTPTKRAKVTKKPFRHVLSDSDDDASITKGIKTVSNNEMETKEKPQKLISPRQMFGSKPISRQEGPKLKKAIQKKEAEVHQDDDFEATLIQLDTSQIEEEYLKESNAEKNGNGHTNVSEKSSKTKKSKEDPEESKVKHNSSKDKKERKRSNEHESKEIHENKQRKSSSDSAKSIPSKTHSKASNKNTKIEIVHKTTSKTSPEKSKTVDVYEERIQKKKQNTALYHQYLERGGARNPGSKEIPVGAEYCLAGLSFLITGVLDSLEREEADKLITEYGGRVLHQVSRKTDYIIVGDQPGPAKLAKAESLNVKKITEDELLEMIRTRPMGSATNVKQSHAKSKAKEKTVGTENIRKLSKSTDDDTEEEKKPMIAEEKPQIPEKITTKPKSPDKKNVVPVSPKPKMEEKETKLSLENKPMPPAETVQALVEKYRPKTMKQILGQQGDKSNAKKLYTWLQNWYKNQNGNEKRSKPSPWAKNDDGGFFKAALLSGPPGIGKTTTAQVVCNELGMDLVEFNASDTRSKKLLKEEVSDLLSNTTMKGFFSDSKTKPKNHVLLMDEVDGMAGNEDRGGLQELISLIKSSDIPVICICNDRNNPKMRTLANYTFDLRFSKPRLEQIRGAMKSVCFKENIQISNEDLDRLIESTNQDIRQVINHLAFMSNGTATQLQSEKKHINKDLRLGPWDVVRKVFSAEEHKSMSLYDKSNLFFHDYNIAPLFVQENYLSVVPNAPRNEILRRVAESADSLALGDLVEKAIRSGGAWSLLPVQAYFSSVIPGTLMSGRITAQITFPSWLGRNSKQNKFDRLTQEIATHARLTTGASKEAVNLDYLVHLRDAIVRPLVTSGLEEVDKSIDVMNSYHLIREDLDSLIELSLWPNQRDPMQTVESKVKAAFTRAYNKNAAPVPYVISGNATKKKSTQTSQEEGMLEEEEEEENNSDVDEDNVEMDKMIKVKNQSTSKKAASEKSEKSTKSSDKPTKRGRGRGKMK